MPFTLQTQTEAELERQAAQLRAQEQAQREAERQAAIREAADRARDTFALTGSDSLVDQAEAAGQANGRIVRRTPQRHDVLELREIIKDAMDHNQESGMVAMVSGGTDCDGVQWSRVDVIPANIANYLRWEQQTVDNAEGPFQSAMMKPSAVVDRDAPAGYYTIH